MKKDRRQFLSTTGTFLTASMVYPNSGFSILNLNQMDKVNWNFISDDPKQSNASGGVFPALFGTLLLVFLMTILVMPFGVLTALYLNEFAPYNYFTIILPSFHN